MIFAVAVFGSAAALADEPELEDTVVIYSTHSEKLLDAVAAAFTEKTGIKVESINLKGELADRVRSEKDNPQADIMYGGDSATYTILQGEGLFEPTFPTWRDELDPMFMAEDGSWYGTIKTPVLLFYNKDTMSAEDAPKDWADLVLPQYKDKIVVRDSLSSSMRSTICNLIDNITATQGEDAAWQYLADLDANIKNYYNSGSMMYSALGKGDADISWAVLSDIVTNRDTNGLPFEIIDAASGSVVLTDSSALPCPTAPNGCRPSMPRCPWIGPTSAPTSLTGWRNGKPISSIRIRMWQKTEPVACLTKQIGEQMICSPIFKKV